ncbi:lipoprotein [Vibrio sp. 2-Bac 85]|uniref:LPS translocon maturation chaperone LptM n=1 Tax=Psychromonas sp. SA13A TaxID=2686346 RepID=UPI00140A292C|nr:lipoprotein [Psychromonas sp. SA13A]
MKKLNLSLIALLFSSLLIGCGMKGPLYREAPPAPKEQPVQNNATEADTTDALNTSQ